MKKYIESYGFGYYVGSCIFYQILPTIEIDSIWTNRLIEMDSEEVKEFNRIYSIWFEKSNEGIKTKKNPEKEWNDLLSFRKKMEKKYLPETINFQMIDVEINNINEFKEGLIVYLWDCDICHYSLKKEDINIVDNKIFMKL